MRHGECMWDVIVVSVFVRWTYLPLLVDHGEASECCFSVYSHDVNCVGQNERYVPIILYAVIIGITLLEYLSI